MQLLLLLREEFFWDEKFLKQISFGGELEFSPKEETLIFNGDKIKKITNIDIERQKFDSNSFSNFKWIIKNSGFSKVINLNSLFYSDEESEKSFGDFLHKITEFYVKTIITSINLDGDYTKAYNSLVSLSKFIGIKIFDIAGTEYPAIPIGVLFSEFFDNKETLQKIENSNPSYLNPVESGLDSLQYEMGLLIVERQAPGVISRYGIK